MRISVVTDEQKKWADDLLTYTVACYNEWTLESVGDYSPMLELIDHICSSCDDMLSIGKSLDCLMVASAGHVESPNNLMDGAPFIGIVQLGTEFEFRDAMGRPRKCPFENARDLFDVQMVRFRIKVQEFDLRNRG